MKILPGGPGQVPVFIGSLCAAAVSLSLVLPDLIGGSIGGSLASTHVPVLLELAFFAIVVVFTALPSKKNVVTTGKDQLQAIRRDSGFAQAVVEFAASAALTSVAMAWIDFGEPAINFGLLPIAAYFAASGVCRIVLSLRSTFARR